MLISANFFFSLLFFSLFVFSLPFSYIQGCDLFALDFFGIKGIHNYFWNCDPQPSTSEKNENEKSENDDSDSGRRYDGGRARIVKGKTGGKTGDKTGDKTGGKAVGSREKGSGVLRGGGGSGGLAGKGRKVESAKTGLGTSNCCSQVTSSLKMIG